MPAQRSAIESISPRVHPHVPRDRCDNLLTTFPILGRRLPNVNSVTQLNECLIEMVIISTPFEEICKELLRKPKRHSITDVLTRGREYEAIQASQASLKSMEAAIPAASVDAMQKSKSCGNCGLHHAPQKGPAYRSVCGDCGVKGLWKQMCQNMKGGTEPWTANKFPKSWGQHTYHRQELPGSKGHTKPQHEVQVYEDDGDQYTKTFPQ